MIGIDAGLLLRKARLLKKNQVEFALRKLTRNGHISSVTFIRRPYRTEASGRLKTAIMLSPCQGRASMSACGVADSAELDILTKALNDYCARHHIANEDGRERIAIRVMSLFGRGVSDPIQLSVELERGSV